MNKKKIEAKIIADSLSPQGNRITTFLLTYPRFIHSELLTHRVFSRNSASSRAIPFEKMVKMVEEDPFIPVMWQRDHKGMQGSEYFQGTCKEEFGHLDRAFAGYQEYQNKPSILQLEEEWLEARDNAVQQAKALNYLGVTKQLCNRLLEPFMWHTVLVTATEWENFFELRCPKYVIQITNEDNLIESKYFRSKRDYNHECYKRNWQPFTDEKDWRRINQSQAEIHMQALAETMWDAYNESTPNQLKSGDWHIPFGDKIDNLQLAESIGFKTTDYDWYMKELWSKIQISTARCARLSYMTFDNEINYQKDIELHDRLLQSGHYSPFEHCARAMSDEEYHSFRKGKHEIELMDNTENHYWFIEDDSGEEGYCNNFKGFIQYRYLIENNEE